MTDEQINTAIADATRTEPDTAVHTKALVQVLTSQRDEARAEAARLRGALLAMREYYRECKITPALYHQVEAALAAKEETK